MRAMKSTRMKLVLQERGFEDKQFTRSWRHQKFWRSSEDERL